MRRFTFPLLLVAAGACAPVTTRPAALPGPVEQQGTPVRLADGPEGESPALSAAAPPAPTARPAVPMSAAMEALQSRELIVPVAGVSPTRIENTFTAPRDGGERQHNAVDILAPRNTPVLSADNGTILRLSTNALGGITVYAADTARTFVYYYAHLERYHEGLAVGQSVQKGDTLGYVGTTGNAPRNVPHLHFQVMLWPPDGRWWNGEPVNPFLALRGARAQPLRERHD